MSRIAPRSRAWQADHQVNFTQGFGYPARSDAESERFENIELARDGTLQSRLGCFQHNSNNIGSEMAVGWGRQYFLGPDGAGGGIGDTIVLTKQGGAFYYTSAPYTQKRPWSALPNSFDPLQDPTAWEACSLVNETPILVFANVNWSSLIYWDGVNGSTSAISGSPANCTLLRFSGERLYASGDPNFPTRIYYSDQGDPMTWPSTNYFDILPNRGQVMGMENSSGSTFCIWTSRSIQGVYGDPAPNGGFSIQMLQDGIGLDSQRGINTFGSLTVFTFQGNLYGFSGSVQDLTEIARGLTWAAQKGGDAGGSGAGPAGLPSEAGYTLGVNSAGYMFVQAASQVGFFASPVQPTGDTWFFRYSVDQHHTAGAGSTNTLTGTAVSFGGPGSPNNLPVVLTGNVAVPNGLVIVASQGGGASDNIDTVNYTTGATTVLTNFAPASQTWMSGNGTVAAMSIDTGNAYALVIAP